MARMSIICWSKAPMSTSVVTPAARVVFTQLHAMVATEPVAKVTIW